ncbi:MAG: hypothetical protein AB7I79_12015 [Rhizobiaceae bacterium]
MEDNYEKYAIAVIIVFGAVAIAGLMGANIVLNDRVGFLLALASAACGWIAGHAMLFDQPRIYGLLIVVAAVCAVGSTVALAT